MGQPYDGYNKANDEIPDSVEPGGMVRAVFHDVEDVARKKAAGTSMAGCRKVLKLGINCDFQDER
jgi:hypothetical protein